MERVRGERGRRDRGREGVRGGREGGRGRGREGGIEGSDSILRAAHQKDIIQLILHLHLELGKVFPRGEISSVICTHRPVLLSLRDKLEANNNKS